MGMQPLSLTGVDMTQWSRSLHRGAPCGDWPGEAGAHTGCPVRGELLRGLCEVSCGVTPPSPSASLPASRWWSPAPLLIWLPELAGGTKYRLPSGGGARGAARLPPTPALGTPMAEGSAQAPERWCWPGRSAPHPWCGPTLASSLTGPLEYCA